MVIQVDLLFATLSLSFQIVNQAYIPFSIIKQQKFDSAAD
jgi:hypothetical protein